MPGLRNSYWTQFCLLGRAMFILFALLASSLDVAAQNKPLTVAHEFLQTLYPETKGHEYAIRFTVTGAYEPAWTFLPRIDALVGRIVPDNTSGVPGRLVPEPKENPVQMELGAHFDFDEKGQIEAVSVRGAKFANDAANDRVRAIVNAHRNWSDDEVIAALKRTGAKYGPNDKEAFLSSLRLTDLKPFFGEIEIRSVEFELRHKQPGGSNAVLLWTVEGEAKSWDGKSQDCSLTFEPFSGKLILFRKFKSRAN